MLIKVSFVLNKIKNYIFNRLSFVSDGSTMNQQDKSTILIEINHVTNSNVSILVDHF